MGPNHVAAHVRGVAAGCQGRGLGSVCDSQLADGLCAHAGLHAPGGQVRPVPALPVLHGGVCALPAVQRRVRAGDSRPLAGRDRELFQDGPNVHHRQESVHRAVKPKRGAQIYLRNTATAVFMFVLLCNIINIKGLSSI